MEERNLIFFTYVRIAPINYKIWDSHSGGYEESCLLGYSGVQSIESQLTFRSNMLRPSSGPKNKPSKKLAWSMLKRSPGVLFGLFFDAEDGGDLFLWNVSRISADVSEE
jgi:hypothetical protein